MLCVLWLGSSVGNLKPHEAVGFFQSVQESSGPNTQVSMQPMFVVQTHNFNFLPFLRITVGQNIVQTQYAYSITHYISQDPLQKTACIVHHSPIMLACCSLRCHGLEVVASPSLIGSALPVAFYNQHSWRQLFESCRSSCAQTCGKMPRLCMQPTVTAKVSQRLSSRTA